MSCQASPECPKKRRTESVRSVRRWLPLLALLLGSVLFLCTFVLSISAAVCQKTQARILGEDELVAMEGEFDAVIVLGCKVYDDGRMSARLEDRVSAGVSLHLRGVGETLLMSGDRRTDGSYDEVGAMKDAAIAAGVDEDRVAVDPRGYSTYESMVRLLEVYEGKRVVIVTQTYHLYRALYIAEKLGIEAYGVSADARPYSDWFRSETREILARVKDVFYMQIRPSVSVES